MEGNTDSKRKITPSIPDNYISILHLQERWIKDKERKRKEEEEERRQKQQRIEDDLKKAEVIRKEEDLDENHLNRSSRKKHWGRNSNKDESFDGGEAKCSEKKEETSPRGDDSAPRDEGLPEKKRGFRRKRYDSKKKKKKNQEVVDECGSSLPPEYTVTENITPVVKDHRKKSVKAKGKTSVESREKAVAVDDAATAIETQFEDLSINKNVKAQTRSSNRNRPNQRRVRMPTETATMVWVKKGQNERAGDGSGSGSGVKPLSS